METRSIFFHHLSTIIRAVVLKARMLNQLIEHRKNINHRIKSFREKKTTIIANNKQ